MSRQATARERLLAIRGQVHAVGVAVAEGESWERVLPRLGEIYRALSAVERILARERLTTLTQQHERSGTDLSEGERRELVTLIGILKPWDEWQPRVQDAGGEERA